MRKKEKPSIARKRPPPGLPAQAPALGYVDIFGYSSAAGGWLFNGWVPRPMTIEQGEPVECVAHYEKSECAGSALLAFYQRDDLDEKSVGLIVYLPSSSRAIGALRDLVFSLHGVRYRVQTGEFTNRLKDPEIAERVRLNLSHQGFATRNREHLLVLTSRDGFSGADTLASLSEPVLLEIDQAIVCPPGGLLLKGWHLSAPGALKHLRVRSGPLASEIDLANAIRVNRPDVIDVMGPQYGFSDTRCGFIAFVSGAVSTGDLTYLEVELASGEVGFKNFSISKRTGIDAIQRTLDGIEISYADIDVSFDRTLGPAIAAINHHRWEYPVDVSGIDFGVAIADPLCTVLIPLYGRVDFMEYQMALFSRSWDTTRIEVIYVLDDPGKQRELEILSRSVFERFRIPFRVLMVQSNLGFAGANNLGLRSARGQYICFLNSDVFPITEKWLERLIAGLEQHPDIGIIGARLLFEDGSVQHEGCYYHALSEFGNWTFIEHLNKGRRPDAAQNVERREVITGACMVLKRDLAEELEGFDEEFIIGDFEDSDLCLKAKARGLGCAVDMGVHLYHLERKSQTSPQHSWRMNLTLYNAWVHERRWFSEASEPVPSGGST